MSDLQTLIDMGFSQERAQKALDFTNNQGVEPAMEWLLAHSDESEVAPSVVSADQSTSAVANSSEIVETASAESSSTENVTTPEAKSLKCDECNRLFKNQMEVEFHAAKSGHSSFSESTEEKRPLTEDEKKAQLARLEDKLRLKRSEREAQEKRDALEKERTRIRSGKDMSEAQRKMEEMEMKKIVEQRKREKEEERIARDRVRAQIESDKAARREKMAALTGKTSPGTPTSPPAALPSASVATSTQPDTPKTPKSYTTTRIQVRLQDGSTLVETFDAKEQLSAVRLFIQLKQNADRPFSLMTTFPRKVYTDEDYEKPLEALGLVPSAVLIVTKAN